MNVVDSSGWLEFFSDGLNAKFFAPLLAVAAQLVVPTITIYEVYKLMRRQRGEDSAVRAASAMRAGLIIDLTAPIAVTSARISIEEGLPMADSIILATARAYGATL